MKKRTDLDPDEKGLWAEAEDVFDKYFLKRWREKAKKLYQQQMAERKLIE